MRKTVFAMLGLLVALSVAPLFADQAANIRTMAGILSKLNHFASAEEKKQLQAIVDDKTASAAEHTVAAAIIGVNHTVTPADKTKLEALQKDAAAPAPLKTMAGILVTLNHTASAADKEALTKLATAK
jgi:hypothetical protein